MSGYSYEFSIKFLPRVDVDLFGILQSRLVSGKLDYR